MQIDSNENNKNDKKADELKKQENEDFASDKENENADDNKDN